MKEKIRYRLKLIQQDGVTCVSVKGSENKYNTRGNKEPNGIYSHLYKDKRKQRFVIINKLIEKYAKLGMEPTFFKRESRTYKNWGC